MGEHTERPILFSSAMVQAILAGRKSQTRRVVKPPQPRIVDCEPRHEKHTWAFWHDEHYPVGKVVRCPYGVPGDRLYVRETWRIIGRMATEYLVDYAAGGHQTFDVGWEGPSPKLDSQIHEDKWHPAIHMPRWASRITLEIEQVRVERIQEISRADAVAEGCEMPTQAHGMHPWPEDRFHERWDALNGKRGFGWEANPWVWVLTFKRPAPIGG